MVKYLILIAYIILMIVVGILSSRKIRNASDYYVAGKKGGLVLVSGSLLATILGSSAILGTSDLAIIQGWAASWLLISASIGLFILVPISRIVNRQGKYTLPQMIGEYYGNEAKLISSFIISFAWTGVIAAQVIGAAKIMNSFFGLDYTIGVWGSGLIFIFYTVIGGQISVLKTDLYQAFLIIGGVLVTAIYVLCTEQIPVSEMTQLKFPFNNGFHFFDLIVLLLTYSTTFVVGPDIYSRLFCARNESIARKSVIITAFILVPFSFLITFLGVYAAYKFPSLHYEQGSALISAMLNTLPDWGVGLLVAALLSAVMSSAATTLLTSSIIISDPISKGLDSHKSLRNTKLIVFIIGLLSIFLSLYVTSIIQSMLIALTVFSGSFIVPTFAGLLGFRTQKWQSTTAIISGGIAALAGKFYGLYGDRTIGNLIIISAFLINALFLFYRSGKSIR
jgi:solute:Na+ symporter, SSS family